MLSNKLQMQIAFGQDQFRLLQHLLHPPVVFQCHCLSLAVSQLFDQRVVRQPNRLAVCAQSGHVGRVQHAHRPALAAAQCLAQYAAVFAIL